MSSDRGKKEVEAEAIQLLVEAKKANKFLLRSKPNVVGMDIGFRVKGGKQTKERVIKVYVTRKIPKEQLAKNDWIPSHVNLGKKLCLLMLKKERFVVPISLTYELGLC